MGTCISNLFLQVYVHKTENRTAIVPTLVFLVCVPGKLHLITRTVLVYQILKSILATLFILISFLLYRATWSLWRCVFWFEYRLYRLSMRFFCNINLWTKHFITFEKKCILLWDNDKALHKHQVDDDGGDGKDNDDNDDDLLTTIRHCSLSATV